MKTSTSRVLLAAALALLAAVPVAAQQITVADARIGSMAKGQDATIAYMNVTAPTETTLISVTTSVAKSVEIAVARNDGDGFKAKPIEGIMLQPNRPLRMRPDSFQVQLKGIAKPLDTGARIPLTLTFRDKIGRMSTVTVFATVQDVPPTASASNAY